MQILNRRGQQLCALAISLSSLAFTAGAATTDSEPNNVLADAYPVLVNAGAKTYQFDYTKDEDWYVFYAKKSRTYNIEIIDNAHGVATDVELNLYNANGDPEIEDFNFDTDFGRKGQGELLDWQAPKEGYYYLKVTNRVKKFSTEARYTLKVFEPLAPQYLFIEGKVVDQCTRKGLAKALIVSSSADQELTAKSGEFGMALNPGSYNLTASLSGYQDQVLSLTETRLLQDTLVVPMTFSLMPRSGCNQATPAATPANPAEAVAEFNANTGLLVVKDVRIGDRDLIAAELQAVSSNTFKLTKVTLLPGPLFAAPTFFDFTTGRAKIPRVYFNGLLFAVNLIDQGNGIFAIDGAPSQLELP